MLLQSLAIWLSLGSLALSSPLRAEPLGAGDEFPSFDEIVKRQDGACTNTPRTRSCWSNGYSISTDFDAKSPPDGTTVTVSDALMALSKKANDLSTTLKSPMSPRPTPMEVAPLGT